MSITVEEKTAGITVSCPDCGSDVHLPRMATAKLSLTRQPSPEEDEDVPVAVIDGDTLTDANEDVPVAVIDEDETAAVSTGGQSGAPVAKARPAPRAPLARMTPLAAVVKERRKGVIIAKAVDTLVPEPRIKPGGGTSPGNFTLKEPTQKPAREVKVKPVLMRAAQLEAAREFQGFRKATDSAPGERDGAGEAGAVPLRPRSRIGAFIGRARDFLLYDPKLRTGEVPEDRRDQLLREQYRLQQPRPVDAPTVDVRPIAKRGDDEITGFHDMMERFVPLHDFAEMEGFAEMSREEQRAILEAQAEVERSRLSSLNRRMFFSALLFAAPAVIAVAILAFHAMRAGDTAATAAGAFPVSTTDARGSAVYSVAEATSLARKVDAAATIEELAGLTRQPEASLPRMRRYYERVAFRPNQLLSIQPGAAGEIDWMGGQFLWLIATTDDYGNRMLAFQKTREGLKLDWESYVNYSEVPWVEFVGQQQPNQAEFRVTLSKDDYYNHAFTEGDFHCYRLTDPENRRTCFGYAPRPSQVAGILEGMLGILHSQAEEDNVEIGRSSVKVIVKMRFPQRTPDAGQAVIDQVVCGGWVMP